VLFWLAGTAIAVAAACSGVDGGDNPPLDSAKPNEPTGGVVPPGAEGNQPPAGGEPEGDDSFQGAGVPEGDAGPGPTGFGGTTGLGGSTGAVTPTTGAGGAGF